MVLHQPSAFLLLLLPRFVHILAAKQLPTLQQNHRPPCRLVGRVDEPTRLDAEPSTLSSSRSSFHLRRVDILAGVELECWLSAVDLQVQVRLGMVKLCQALQWLAARVKRDLGRITFNDKYIVNVWL